MFSKQNIISHFCRIYFTDYFKKMLNSSKLAEMWLKYYISFFLPLPYAVNCLSSMCRTPVWKEETLPHLEEEKDSFAFSLR